MLPELRTPRLRLTPVDFDDVDALWALWTDSAVRRFLWDDEVISRDEAEETVRHAVESSNRGLGLWALRTPVTNTMIGCAGLRETGQSAETEVLVAVSPPHQSRGFASEAIDALVHYAFDELHMPEVAAAADVPNVASHRMLERQGFERVSQKESPRGQLVYYVCRAPSRNTAYGELFVRDFEPEDTAEIVQLFRDTVRKVNVRDYTAEQIAAWAPEVIDSESWRDRLCRNYTYVAESDGAILGFIDFDMRGYVDCLYVHTDLQGRGIASALLARIEKHARAVGLARLRTDASITALPFFERRGFQTVEQREVERGGARFINYRMEKVFKSV